MPRQSRASLSITPIGFLPHLEPPADLTGLEREIWLETVNAAPAEFEPEDRELLRCYCVAAAQFRRSTEGVAAGDMQALKVQAASSAMMCRMATRLRLGPRGRRPNGTRVSGKREVSAYELMDGPASLPTFKGFGK